MLTMDDNDLIYIVTGDETQIYDYDMETAEQLSEYRK